MADGLQTVYRQFVIGPAQRASSARRRRFYPELSQIAGRSEALAQFTELAASSQTLEALALAFGPRVAMAEPLVGEEATTDRYPQITRARVLLDNGLFAEAGEMIRAGASELRALRREREHLHGALLGYLADGHASPVGEYSLKLLKILWIGCCIDQDDDDSRDFIRQFWTVGTPTLQISLPRSADDVWAAAGPAAQRARSAKAPVAVASPPASPPSAELAAARSELEFLHRIQTLAAPRERSPAPPPEAPPEPEPGGLLAAILRAVAGGKSRLPAPVRATAVSTAPQIDGDSLLAETRQRMSDSTRSILDRLGFDPAVHQITSMIRGIDAAIQLQQVDLDPSAQVRTVVVGGNRVQIDSEIFGAPLCDEPEPDCHCDLLVELDNRHGARPLIHVLGSGRAYRIDQTHSRYLPGQLVHTENHEQGATRSMSFRRLERAEQTDETETETEEFREAETTSHDQFETSKEIGKAAQEQAEMSAGISATASYGYAGGSASLSGHYDISSADAAQTSEKIATRQAKEIIARAVESMKQKQRTRRVVKSLTETERLESASIDNSKGKSRTDFYRGIDQEYSNQLVSVGERLMVRLTLQEPMAWLLYALAQRSAPGQILTEPVKPNIAPTNIDAANYASLASQYEAKGIQPPPATVYISHNVHHDPTDIPWIDNSGTIDLPTGTYALGVNVVVLIGPTGGDAFVTVAVGGQWMKRSASDGSQYLSLDPIEGKLAYAVRVHDNDFSITFVVSCMPTDTAIAKWKLETHGAIMTAYRAKRDAYEAQLQAAQFAGGPGIDERNPAINRVLIEQELQKFVLGATYPPTYFRSFDSMKFAKDCSGSSGGTIPEPDFVDAWGETPWITFLSQLYEWKNMTYQFLPYSFGRRSHWKTLRGRTSNDPYFERAISAGAIIVDLPVAKHMTDAFLWFLSTGKPWGGGDMPIIGAPGYQDLAIAIRDSEVKDGDPVGEPWLTVVPTSLVYIDDKRPDHL